MKKKEKNKLFEGLPACAAEFIKLVVKKMRYRRKVRADVMAELVAHFEDELKDCKTDEEKEQKAQQLITEFGDVKLLAVLMRRAKKRCRPLWRTAVARTLQTAGVLILCLIAYIAWFLSGKPAVTIDYVAEFNRIACPPAEQKQLINKWLVDNNDTLELVIEGTKKPFFWQKYNNKKEEDGMMGILLPNLSGFRTLAYSLRWRIWLNAEQGRYEDAFDDIKSCYRFGQQLKGEYKSLIEQLVGIAIEAMALQAIRDTFDRHQFDSAALTTLQRDFEQMIADENFTVDIKTEKLFKYDEIQRCFTEDRLGGGHICLEGLKRLQNLGEMESGDFYLFKRLWNKSFHILFTHPNKQETKEMVDHLYGYWEKIMHKTPAQIRAEGIDIGGESMKIIKGNILLEILLPAYQRIHQIGYRLSTEVNATLAIIATLRYKQKTGNYPDSLNELITAGFIKQLPMDAFSDKPFVYRKTDDNFILYSVGLNFTDDGGHVYRDDKGKVNIWTNEGDAVFWPVPKSQVKQQQ